MKMLINQHYQNQLIAYSYFTQVSLIIVEKLLNKTLAYSYDPFHKSIKDLNPQIQSTIKNPDLLERESKNN